jgi:ABC-type spermidine/putrescine transport system permease subunit II
MIMAVPAALAVTRSGYKYRRIVYILLLSPLIVPAIIGAIGVFFLFSWLRITGTVLGMVLGHGVASLSLATVVLLAALRNFDFTLERAALSLGATPLRTTLRVTLPVISTAVFTAAFFGFLQSWDELLIALFVSGIGARTLPKKLWESLLEVNPTVAAVSTLLLVFVVSIMGLLYLVRRAGGKLGLNEGRRARNTGM